MLNKDDWDRAEILLFGSNDFNDKENMSIKQTFKTFYLLRDLTSNYCSIWKEYNFYLLQMVLMIN